MSVIGIHPEELFDKLLDGELSLAERERLRAHLDGCEVCRFEYAARLDFQAEALELGALGALPVLPLRPLLGVEAPAIVPRRRRSRRLVWGLAAAALISASGAVASGLAGKAPWRAMTHLFEPVASPAERVVVSLVKPAGAHGGPAAAPTPVSLPPASAAAAVEAPSPVAASPAQPAAHAPAPANRPELRAPASLALNAPAPVSVEGASATVEATPGVAAAEPVSAAKLFGEANQARRSGDVGRASGLYHLLQDQFPGSPEAELSRVTLAMLLLDNGDAQGALNDFERYLAGGSRGLEAEALVGRARALGRLGRRDLEGAAWSEVLRKYPHSIYGRQATERLSALGQP